MDMQKEIGPAKVEVLTANGAVVLKAEVAQALGGGSAAGVVAAKASIEIDLSAAQALDLADAMLKAHFPGMASIIDGAIAAGKAELAKI